ncbi:ADP-ribosylglycohydrolase family protein [Micromonospora sp. WMMD1128]|uniref:ADP-ribosylglycohydrolase family protein n=1 Tax=unclassified Micromonospora TaxID=2617518 RepID=UPI00248AF400|nr:MULTISPECIES: ADP-ribosylglycohydrolase family protein [unclassified Micromonospora]WBB73844.1 ADP-ribosylglycohydrolase family protein [Micromonospora sp. WMMD1128]WFE32751.1 ADP-ribosylglycohydrolase family protein [Micromonospora sp. WMMD975]
MVETDYAERVYAGVLGKIIAVYLGRPYEGWTHEKISAELGDITYYVNDRWDVALKHHLLVVADDDISGTFVFPRVLARHPEPTSAEVGHTWLNEIVENVSVLWWGGLGNSTEHTAYLRMKAGVVPPESGSIARNGTVVAEQVGAQIFVEGFAMTRPGDPVAAADLAERAARVSHDGESIHAARVVAALVAGAFTEPDMDRLLDTAVGLIPADSLIARVIADVRAWSAQASDWREVRDRIDEVYGYHRYGGNCHVVPNHATVIHALVHSGGEFADAMKVVCTSGWDTDSNAGNVGAICGVRGGLAGLADPDWRGPLADRMYLPTVDGGSSVTDAATEAINLANHGLRWAGHEPLAPKDGARFHFGMPGSTQGFTVRSGVGTLRNTAGRLDVSGPATVTTPTFVPPEALDMPIYGMVASPTLYPGQTITATFTGAAQVSLLVSYYGADGELHSVVQAPQPAGTLAMRVPDLGGHPVAAVGFRTDGPVALDRLTWDGAPTMTLTRPADGGTMWRRAWVQAADQWLPRWPEPFRVVQNSGTGLLVHGEAGWRDYTVTADVTPHLARAAGLAARVQGARDYYALELVGQDTARLVCGERVLADTPWPWEFGATYTLTLTVAGSRLTGAVDGEILFDLHDEYLAHGGIALLVTEGRTATHEVRITPHTPLES